MKKNKIIEDIRKDISPLEKSQVDIWFQAMDKISKYLETNNKTEQEFCNSFYKPEDAEKFFDVGYIFSLEELVEIESIIDEKIFD